MATKKDSDKQDAGVHEVKVDGSDAKVTEVIAGSGDNTSDKYGVEQNEALQHYRLTGESGVYVDPSRDQEADIAPEIGVYPQPDMANPAPPETSFDASALDPGKNPVVKDVNTKAEDNAEAAKAYSDYVQKRQDSFDAAADAPAVAPQPVYTVDAPKASKDEVVPAPGPDESSKTAQGDPRAKK